MIGFWNWLLHGRELKLSHLLYQYLYHSNTNSKWLQCIKNTFVEIGRFDIWQMQGQFHMQSLSSNVKYLLMDQYIQIRFGSSTWSSKSTIYFSFKSTFSSEKYLTVLPKKSAINIFRFRTGNHGLPKETGRWDGTDLHDRKCNQFHLNEVGDVFIIFLYARSTKI